MKTVEQKGKRARKIVMFLVGGMGLIALMLYMAGVFTRDKIQPGTLKEAVREPISPYRTGQASIEKITEFYEAVGTIRPKRETQIEAQVMGKIVDVLVRPGDAVDKGQRLVVLDSRQIQARLAQARQGLASAKSKRKQAEQALVAAKAAFKEAESAFNRTKSYFEEQAATAQELERVESGYLQARAALQRAEEALSEADAGVLQAEKVVEEARIGLGYAQILSPKDGQVAKRLVEPGDLAVPGKPLLVLQTTGTLRLEALVREGLIHRVAPGTELEVVVNALGKSFGGTVEEVVPSADPATRTFLVKVGLPEEGRLLPGMFGRLLVPVKDRQVILVSQKAIQRIGQLEVVTVETDGRWQRIFVKTGRVIGDQVEVLSGLHGGEKVALEGEGDA
jgi:RND family efflux transporter MFP subunit